MSNVKINKIKCQMSKINKDNFDGAYLRSSSGHFLYGVEGGHSMTCLSPTCHLSKFFIYLIVCLSFEMEVVQMGCSVTCLFPTRHPSQWNNLSFNPARCSAQMHIFTGRTKTTALNDICNEHRIVYDRN